MNPHFPIRSKSNLSEVSSNLSLRCDAKQSEPRFKNLDDSFSDHPTFFLNKFMPEPFVKGKQPSYLDEMDDIGIAYVVNTLAVQNLVINASACRWITLTDFNGLNDGRKLNDGDVVLTVDGGTSIGKAAVFSFSEFKVQLGMDESESLCVTVDSHVAIIRPKGISTEALVYLLASPIGQLQFQKAESGASGQTAVSEADIRTFKFPQLSDEQLTNAVKALKKALQEARNFEQKAESTKKQGWEDFSRAIIEI